MVTCPNGHSSSATDYCDVCGAPIPASAVPTPPPSPVATDPGPSSKACPNCTAANPPGALFCEACGYDFTTGSLPRGMASAPVLTAEPIPAASARPNPFDLDAPPPPAPAATPVDPTDVAAEMWAPTSVPPAQPVAAPVAPAPAAAPVPAAAAPAAAEPAPVAGPAPVAAPPVAPPGPSVAPATPVPPPGLRRLGGATAFRPETPAQPMPASPGSSQWQPVTPAPAAMPDPALAPPVAPMGLPAGAFAPVPPGAPAAATWVAEVWIDPDWYAGQDSPDQLPSPGLPRIVGLRKRTSLIGRPSKSRGIEPDVDCEPDTGVSRRHAELTTDGTRWWVEDLGSANGTFVGQLGTALPEQPIAARTEVDMDARIYVGSWTRIVIRPAGPDEADL